MLITIIILSVLVGIWTLAGFGASFQSQKHRSDILDFILFGPATWIAILIVGFILIVYRFICCLLSGFKEW